MMHTVFPFLLGLLLIFFGVTNLIKIIDWFVDKTESKFRLANLTLLVLLECGFGIYMWHLT